MSYKRRSRVIEWYLKLYVRFYAFSKSKNVTSNVGLSCCTRFTEHCLNVKARTFKVTSNARDPGFLLTELGLMEIVLNV